MPHASAASLGAQPTPAAPTSFSPLQRERLAFRPGLPAVLSGGATTLSLGAPLAPIGDAEALRRLFPSTYGLPTAHFAAAAGAAGAAGAAAKPLRIGCVLSGGQAPGGHNVISGLFDACRAAHAESVLFGFLDGPRGLFAGKFVEITPELMAGYRNMGGFDIIGSGRDKIETPEQFAGARAVAKRLELDGVVIIGGDDSNTNAALLAEDFAREGLATRVIGCPKTIDGDLKIPGHMDISFGFDTACKIYSELIGNVCLDALSSGKYYHFIRLMGRAASNITLECALQTQPNVTLLGEEVAARKQNLSSLTEEVVGIILERAAAGKNYGVILVPEGLIEFVPEMNVLLHEINELLATGTEATVDAVREELSPNSAALFAYLPANIRKQLLADRDPHGNVNVSLIETEKLLAETVQHELHRLAKHGAYKASFTPQFHFFGYEGRCGMPSDFDTLYCYALGFNAATLIRHGQTGLMSAVLNLAQPVAQWTCGGLPLTALMNLERRHGKDKPVIKKALVELDSAPFKTFAAKRREWAVGDHYRTAGPVQLSNAYEDAAVARPELCFTLKLELAETAGKVAAAAAAAAAVAWGAK
jgi:pyrophosphate--fructose-6-phosphate 1-phosphotransferase